MASSATALATASAGVGPYGTPSAIERTKWYASMTFRSSYPMLLAEPGWKAAYSPCPGPTYRVLTGWSW